MSFEGPTIKGHLQTKLFDVILTSFSLALFVTLLCVKILPDSQSQVVKSAPWEITVVLVLVSLLIQFGLQIYKRNEIKTFLRLLHVFDSEVSQKNLEK